jgi:hypothetical protein
VVLTPSRRCQVGGDKPPATVAKERGSPGRARRKPLKPLRAERRVFRGIRGDYARMLSIFCIRGCGCPRRPAFRTPSLLGRRWCEACPGRVAAAGMRRCASSSPQRRCWLFENLDWESCRLLPSPGGGGSTRLKGAAGWGDGLSTPTVPELRDCHPTPSRISLRSIRADPPPQGEGKRTVFAATISTKSAASSAAPPPPVPQPPPLRHPRASAKSPRPAPDD